jgi:hypothetical protein
MAEQVITLQQRYNFIAEKLKTVAGRQYLAAQMTQPLRKFRDYVAVGRRAFLVDVLGEGDSPEYELDPDVSAWVIGQESGEYRNVFNSDKIMVDLFTIAASPDISLTKMKRRKYNVQDRIKIA